MCRPEGCKLPRGDLQFSRYPPLYLFCSKSGLNGTDALEFSVVAGDLKECTECLDILTAESRDDDSPALWPFIKLIRYVWQH
jgi:hypothetical protein